MSCQDTLGASEWDHVYDANTEMVIGIGTGATVDETLRAMSSGTSKPGDPRRPVVGLGGVAKAFKTHNERLRAELEVAALYRSKPTLVMWSSEYATRPRRLERIAKQLGMVREMRGDVPVYVRRLSHAYATHTN